MTKIENLIAAGNADIEAAARYRSLIPRRQSCARDYSKRAVEAERIGRAKLAEAASMQGSKDRSPKSAALSNPGTTPLHAHPTTEN